MPDSIHQKRFESCRARIDIVLNYTIGWLSLPTQSYPYVFVARCAKEYLQDLSTHTGGKTRTAVLIERLEKIKNCVAGTGAPSPTWDIASLQWKTRKEAGNAATLNMAFAHSPIRGGNGDKIRIQQKAWTLPNYVLEGVMVHEVTHFAFGTEDNPKMGTFGGYYVLSKDQSKYDESDKWHNADNWRLFYQAMRLKLIAEL